jgi:DNA-binding response OmpR family regulator
MTEDQSPLRRGPILSLGNLTVSLDTYSVYIADQFVELTQREFDVLLTMVEHPNKVLLYSELTAILRRGSDRPQIRNLAVVVHRLRRKLSGCSPYVIRTIRGRGYGLIKGRGPPPPFTSSAG